MAPETQLPPDGAERSVLYAHSSRVPFASRLAWRARREIFDAFLTAMRPGPYDAVLDVGVTCDQHNPESNFFEQLYPHPQNVTCVGTEDGSHLERKYPGMRFRRVSAGDPLPFPDKHFAIAFSNAVVEHVGSAADQRAFIAEMSRVSKRFFLATPNRWFPVEPHTGLPLVHYLPAEVFRALLRPTRYAYWADEQHLNLLSQSDLHARLPGTGAVVQRVGIGFGPFTSNLVAFG